MVQHGAALCQLWHVQVAENAQKVPKFACTCAPQEGVHRDVSPTAALGAGMGFGATR